MFIHLRNASGDQICKDTAVAAREHRIKTKIFQVLDVHPRCSGHAPLGHSTPKTRLLPRMPSLLTEICTEKGKKKDENRQMTRDSRIQGSLKRYSHAPSLGDRRASIATSRGKTQGACRDSWSHLRNALWQRSGTPPSATKLFGMNGRSWRDAARMPYSCANTTAEAKSADF